eukprot:scaffold672472_cov50-Prasinocladus_malaysianus.AAC.1
MVEMVKEYPQTLTSLGANSGIIMQVAMHECDDNRLVKWLLELYKDAGVTPLLPYGPKVCW